MKNQLKITTLGLIFLLSACGGGVDSTDDGTLDSNSHTMVAKANVIPPGDADCAYGGISVEMGIDENDNGILDADEINNTEKVCHGTLGADGVNGADGASGVDGSNGTDGSPGADGSSIVMQITAEAVGANCTTGGQRIESWLDIIVNGLLDASETTSTVYVCNGLDWWAELGATGSLEGYVYLETGVPAEGAILFVSGTGNYAFADGFGFYQFSQVAVGHQSIGVSMDGHYSQRLEDLPVTEGNTSFVRDINLNKQRAPFASITSLANAVRFQGQVAHSASGIQLAKAGDINGDGLDDILIGAVPYDAEIYLIYGRRGLDLTNTLSLVPDVTLSGITANDDGEFSMVGVGDVNGDGFDDILIGAPETDPGGGEKTGESYLVYGSANLPAIIFMDNADVTFKGLLAFDYSGSSVSNAGDVNGDGFNDLLIGAYGADPNGIEFAGQSYLIYGGISLVTKLDPAGSMLLSDADVILNGITTRDVSGTSVAGAGDVNGDGFDDLLIGAHGANSNTGESYLVYGGTSLEAKLDPAGHMSLSTADVTLIGIEVSDHSGVAVAGAGDTNGDGFNDLLIGAWGAGTADANNVGESYLIYGSGALSVTVALSDANVIFRGNAANNYSGVVVASAGDINQDGFDDILIGAYGVNGFAGESYLIYGAEVLPNVTTLDNADIIFTGLATKDYSGKSLAGIGDVNGDGFDDLLIGASAADPEDLVNAGESYLFMGRPRGVNTVSNQLSGNYSLSMADARFMGAQADDQSAYSVASAGDVNGDGLDDILIGAYYADPGGNVDAGETYLVYGQRDMDINQALGMEVDVTFIGATAGDRSGRSVAGAGDVNGDGYDDIFIGASYASPGGKIHAGNSYLVYGGTSLPANLNLSAADVILSGVTADDESGNSVAGVGDVNGDGYDDLLIGAAWANPNGNDNAGESYLIYGGRGLPANLILSNANVTFTGIAVNDNSGISVAGAGDVNGDGFDDLLIGAEEADPGGKLEAGESYLIYGGLTLPTSLALSSADVKISGVVSNDHSGISVASAGDVNGDGYNDILIGASNSSPGDTFRAGESYLVFGGSALPASLILSSADVTFHGLGDEHYSGVSLAGAGDVNGDGYDDMLIGAPGASPGGNSLAGESYLVYGRPDLPASMALSNADLKLSGAAAYDQSGYPVAGAGDINGDGFNDILIGAYWANSFAGETYLFLGQGSRPIE